MVMPYDPSTATAPQPSPFKLSSDPGFLQALSGFASGNNVGEQFASVNNILAGNAEKQKAEEVKNQTLGLLQGSPELAAAVKAGAMTPSDAVSAMMRQQAEAKAAAQPKYQLQNINGHLVRVEVNSGKLDELGNYEKAAEPTAAYKDFQQTQSDPAYADYLKQQEAAKNTPPIAKEYEWATNNGFKGTPQEYQAWKANLSKQKGMTVEYDPVNGFKMTQGDVDKAPPKLTESQSKDMNFLTRAKKANDDLAPLEGQLTSFAQKRVTGLPYDIGNYLQTPEYQKAQQAGREVLAIILRKDSGAAITDQEMDNYGKIYLPQPGDDAATIATKRRSRETAIEAIQKGLGPLAPKDAVTPDAGVIPAEDYFKGP